MTRPSKRKLESTVDDLDTGTATTPGDEEALARAKDALEGYPDCDFEEAIAALDALPDPPDR